MIQATFAVGSAPRFSLVIPAWNEEKYLPRLLDTVERARERYRGGGEAIEVIVADNVSTDRTAAIAGERGCRVARVEKRRIAAARNGGAKIARGEIICFVDADYRIHPETFNAIDAVMNARIGRGRGAGSPRYIGGGTGLTMERWSLGIRVTYAAILPMLLLLRIDGGVWFCRRADFFDAGGYDESQLASEDVRFLWSLKKLGRRRRPRQKLATRFDAKRVGIEPALALCSTRKFDTRGDWHFLFDFYRAMTLFVLSKKRFERYAQRYWYEDDRQVAPASRTDEFTAETRRRGEE